MLQNPALSLFINGAKVGGEVSPAQGTFNRNLETITDTAAVMFPSTLHGFQIKVEADYRRSNYAEIKAGWEDQFHTEFKGFISNVSVSNQVRFDLWDFSWLFKITKVEAKTFGKNATAQDVLNYLAEQVTQKQKKLLELAGVEEIEVAVDQTLKEHYLPNVRIVPGYALEKLMSIKQFLPYPMYFRDNVLCLWRRYRQDTAVENSRYAEVNLTLEENTMNVSLEYFHATDRDYEIQCQTVTREGNLITGTAAAGIAGGEFIRLHYPNGGQSPEVLRSQLQDKAEAMLEVYVRPGFDGSMSTWISPRIDTCTHIVFKDSRYKAREGIYYVHSFAASVGTQGSHRQMGVKQILTLEKKELT